MIICVPLCLPSFPYHLFFFVAFILHIPSQSSFIHSLFSLSHSLTHSLIHSLSLSLTHTHTHTHTLSLPLSVPHPSSYLSYYLFLFHSSSHALSVLFPFILFLWQSSLNLLFLPFQRVKSSLYPHTLVGPSPLVLPRARIMSVVSAPLEGQIQD